MRLVTSTTPRPRLLSSAVPENILPVGLSEKPRSRINVGRMLGIILGASVLVALGIILIRTHFLGLGQMETRGLLPRATSGLATSPQSTATPAPIAVQLSPDMLRVTAISLGHPRLALINGKQVGEGDSVTLHTPNRSVALSLRVLKIEDGQIALSDGSQTFVARLSKPIRAAR